jgi:hypothetical protein
MPDNDLCGLAVPEIRPALERTERQEITMSAAITETG